MNSKLFFLLLFSSLVALHGCDKVDDVEDPPLTLADFLNNNKPALQTFHVTAGTVATITGAKGAKISFGANSFFTMSGDPVTSGDVEIQLREVTTKKDMVLSQTPTISGDELLVSEGVYFLKALQNGFELFVRNFTIERTWYPQPQGEMDAFLGGFYNGSDDFSWYAEDGVVNGIGIVQDTIIQPSDSVYYTMSVFTTFLGEHFNWINCDYFYPDSAAPPVAVLFPTSDNIDNYFFQSYLVFNDLNAVLHYNSYSSNQIEFFNIPSGLNATLVTYYIVDGKVFVATANITVSNALSTPITFSETTEQGLLDILGGL